MRITFSMNSLRFLDKVRSQDKEKVRQKIKKLVEKINDTGIIPYNEFNIKRLKGEWLGYFRMRIGKIRVIFTIDRPEDEIKIVAIDFRGNIYH